MLNNKAKETKQKTLAGLPTFQVAAIYLFY